MMVVWFCCHHAIMRLREKWQSKSRGRIQRDKSFGCQTCWYVCAGLWQSVWFPIRLADVSAPSVWDVVAARVSVRICVCSFRLQNCVVGIDG